MTQELQAQLKATSVLDIPFQIYDQKFTFIVNGSEYRTIPLISDLLSPRISQIYQTDPTISTFTITTESRGDFNHILNLITFTIQSIPPNEISFFSDVIEKLGNHSIAVGDLQSNLLTNENVIQLLKHQITWRSLSIRLKQTVTNR